MNISDILISSGEDGNGNMDLSYDNAELMSSEFFDSVLSLENDLEDGFLSNFEDENNMSSDASHIDEVLSPQSYCSESDKNSTYSTSENNTDTESSAMLNSIDGLDDPLLLSFLDTITQPEIKTEPIVKTPPPTVVCPSVPKTTKILIQNPSNKKFIAKPLANATQLRKPISKVKPQILKVQQVTNNGRPVLLPLSFKSIKILNTAADVASLTNGQNKKRKIESTQQVCEVETERIPANNQYPPLTLSNEEKRLLAKEGIQLPTHYPLTKNEERELKRIRRKIRNKISAQDSRKRKKEYVDGLEERVKRGSEENKNLLQRVKELQRQNRTLIAHVNRLQALICKSSTSKATPSTCLMVVLLSALLVSLPNMKLFENKQMSSVGEQLSIRRSLLSDLQATAEDDLNMEEFLIFKDDDEPEAKFGDDAQVENSTEKEFAKMLGNMSKKYGEDNDENDGKNLLKRMMDTMKKLFSNQNSDGLDVKPSFGGSYNKKGFIEPDIDDYHPGDEAPPLKRARMISDYEVGSTTNIDSEAIISSTVTKDK